LEFFAKNMNKAHKVLITGAAGFIGYHLARRLLAESASELVLVDNMFRGQMDMEMTELIAHPRVTFLNLDLTNPASYDTLKGGFAHAYHLAAVNGTQLFYDMPHEVLRINTASLMYFLEWFRTYNIDGKMLFTSSNEAYAGGLNAFNSLPIPTPEAVPLVVEDTYNPRWTYAATKMLGELFVINYGAKYGFRAVIVRPHNFYGPRAGHSHVIPELSSRIARRINPFTLHSGDDKTTRSFCYITDAVRAMQTLMDSETTDNHPVETVHIGVDEETTINTVVEKLFAVSGWRPKTIIKQEAPLGSVVRRRGSIEKLKRMIGWRPEVGLDRGLQLTYRWYVDNSKPI
jgi:nucleoside-diphosphate-sugar epimerase